MVYFGYCVCHFDQSDFIKAFRIVKLGASSALCASSLAFRFLSTSISALKRDDIFLNFCSLIWRSVSRRRGVIFGLGDLGDLGDISGNLGVFPPHFSSSSSCSLGDKSPSCFLLRQGDFSLGIQDCRGAFGPSCSPMTGTRPSLSIKFRNSLKSISPPILSGERILLK